MKTLLFVAALLFSFACHADTISGAGMFGAITPTTQISGAGIFGAITPPVTSGAGMFGAITPTPQTQGAGIFGTALSPVPESGTLPLVLLGTLLIGAYFLRTMMSSI